MEGKSGTGTGTVKRGTGTGKQSTGTGNRTGHAGSAALDCTTFETI